MVKALKTTAIVLLCISTLLAVAAISVVVLFPGERIRVIAERKAGEALGVPVSIGGIGVSFAGIPAVKVSRVRMGEPRDGERHLFTLEYAKVRVNLLRLLKKRVEIVSVELVKPEVTVITRGDGSSNLPPEKEAAPGKAGAAGAPFFPFPVTLNTIKVRDARVVLDDSRTSGNIVVLENVSADMNLTVGADLKDLDMKGETRVGNVTLSIPGKNRTFTGIASAFRYELTGDPAAGNFTLTRGELTLNGVPVSVGVSVTGWTRTAFSVKAEDVSFADLLRAVPAGVLSDRGEYAADGAVSLAVHGGMDTEPAEPSVTYDGRLDVEIESLNVPGAPRSIDEVTCRIAFSEKEIHIEDAGIHIGNSRVSILGMVSDYLEDPSVSLELTGELDLAETTDAVPLPGGIDMEGAVDFNMSAAGRPSEPASLAVNGGMRLGNVLLVAPKTLRHPAELNGTVTLTPSAVRIESVTVRAGVSDFRLDADIANYAALAGLKDGAARLTGELKSGRLDLNDLLVPEEEDRPVMKPWDLEETLAGTPVPPSLEGELRIELGTVIFGRLESDSMKGRIVFGDGVFALKDLAAVAYGGTLTGSGAIDFSGPEDVTYGGEFRLGKLDAARFVADFLGVGEIIHGKLSVSLRFSGAGMDSVSMLDNLKAEGDMSFTGGRIVNWEFTRKLGGRLKFLDFDTLDFDSITNTFRVENRRFITPDMALKARFGELRMDGSAGFDGTLDYDMVMILDGETSKRALRNLAALSKYIDVSPERLELNVRITGDFESPVFEVDTSAAEKLLKEALGEKITREAGRFLESEDADRLKKKGKKILEGLFKKK